MRTSSFRELERTYFAKRAAQEMAAARAAAGLPSEAPHRTLAERYALLASSIGEVQRRLG